MTTEAEAKERWCPLVQYRQGSPENRDACYDRAGTHCIGSACMMWRWEESFTTSDSIEPDWYKLRLVKQIDSRKQGVARTQFGYCGLAGKP